MKDNAISAVKSSLKVSGYLIVSVLLAVFSSQELRDFLAENPKYATLLALIPVINIALKALAKFFESSGISASLTKTLQKFA